MCATRAPPGLTSLLTSGNVDGGSELREWISRLAALAGVVVGAVLGASSALARAEPVAGEPESSYLVVLSAGDPGRVATLHSQTTGADVRHVYRYACRGYAATMSAAWRGQRPPGPVC